VHVIQTFILKVVLVLLAGSQEPNLMLRRSELSLMVYFTIKYRSNVASIFLELFQIELRLLWWCILQKNMLLILAV